MDYQRGRDGLVSIIVPVYKAESYISATIGRVQKQTYTDWELILVDDASPDRSSEIIKEAAEADARIKLIEKKANEGAAAARNTGISAARGRYIAFLDADDVWMSDKLQKELEFVVKNKVAFAFTAYEFGDENAKPTGKVVHVPDQITFKEALSRTIIFTSTVMIDRWTIPEELIRMPLIESEDTATWWTIMKNGYVANGLDDVLTVYRRPANSLSSNKIKAVKRIWGLYRKIAGLSLISSLIHCLAWGVRATLRRL